MDTNKPQFTSIAKGQLPLSSGLNSLSLNRHRLVTRRKIRFVGRIGTENALVLTEPITIAIAIESFLRR